MRGWGVGGGVGANLKGGIKEKSWSRDPKQSKQAEPNNIKENKFENISKPSNSNKPAKSQRK